MPLTFTNIAVGGSLTFDHTGGGSPDDLVVNAVSAGDTFMVTGAADSLLLTNQVNDDVSLQVFTPGIGDLDLQGVGPNTLFAVSGPLPYTTTTLNGIGTASLTGATGAVTVNLADPSLATNTTITGYGGTVSLVGATVANLDTAGNDLTINGTAESDNLTYTPTGPAAGTVTNAGLNTVFNFTTAGLFTLDGLGGINSVTVNGTATADTINVVKGATTTVQVNGLETVNLPWPPTRMSSSKPAMGPIPSTCPARPTTVRVLPSTVASRPRSRIR